MLVGFFSLDYLVSIIFFPVEKAGSALRQPQAGSTVLLQSQRVSYGEPPNPSASDLALELDQY